MDKHWIGLIALAVTACGTGDGDNGEPAGDAAIPAEAPPPLDERAALMAEVERLEAVAANDTALSREDRSVIERSGEALSDRLEFCASDEPADECRALAYTMRIADLRTHSAAARGEASDGVSSGPVRYRCEGIEAPVEIVFVATDPGAVRIAWDDRALALRGVPSASGGKYAGSDGDEDGDPVWEFWTQDGAANLIPPGGPDRRCAVDDPLAGRATPGLPSR